MSGAATSVVSREWRDPGKMMRLAALQLDPLAMEAIVEWVAGGGTLRRFARDRGLPRGALMNWVLGDEGRFGLYRRALVAGGFSESDEMKEIADGVPRQAIDPDGKPLFDKDGRPVLDTPDPARDKLRCEVRRFRTTKHAPEYYGERVDLVHHRSLPSEEQLMAQLDALIAGRPGLLDALLERRARLATPIAAAAVTEI